MDRSVMRSKAVMLRKQGRTYSEIASLLNGVPKGTLSYWLHSVQISPRGKRRHARATERRLRFSRKKAVQTKLKARMKFFRELKEHNTHLMPFLKSRESKKLLLVLLYAAEGSKGRKTASVVFGNSDHRMIRIFLSLLRGCYAIDEKKFRCTVQCRADMSQKTLERFWSRVTAIPLNQFYMTRIDPRTRGKRTAKVAYKGVCRVQYFSAHIFHELMIVYDMIADSI